MRTCRSYFPSLALAIVAVATMGLASAYGAALFVVDGSVSEPDGTPVAGLTVAVQNLSKPALSTYESEATSEEGTYGVTMVRDFITSVSDEGDQLLVQAIDTSGAVDVVRGQVVHTITAIDGNRLQLDSQLPLFGSGLVAADLKSFHTLAGESHQTLRRPQRH